MNPSPWQRRLAFSGGLIVLATGVSQVCGMVRELLCAHYFGTRAAAAAFFAAWTIPEIVVMIISGAFGATLVSLYSETAGRERKTLLLTALAVVAVVVCLAAVLLGLLAPALIRILYLPFDPETTTLCVTNFRLLMPVMVILVLEALLAAVLQAGHRFKLIAISQIVAAVGGLAALVVLVNWFDSYALALSLGVTAVLAFLIKAAPLRSRLAGVRIALVQARPFLARWWWLTLPLMFGTVIVRLNPLVDSVMGLYLGPEALAVLHYAYNIYFFPYLLFGASLGTVLYPHLTEAFAGGQPERMRERLVWGIKLTVLALLPITIALLVLARPLLTVLLQHGAFSGRDVQLTAWVLQAYTLGLVVTGINGLYSRTLVALQDRRGVFGFTLLSFFGNIVLNAVNIVVLGMDYRGMVGIALSTTMMAYILCALARRRIEGRLGALVPAGVVRAALRPLLAALVMLAVTALAWWWWSRTGGGRAWQILGLGLAGSSGVLVYVVILREQVSNVYRIMAGPPPSRAV